MSLEDDQIKNEGVRVVTTLFIEFSDAQGQLEWSQDFPIITYGSYLLPWKPDFRADLAQNRMQSITHPNDAPDEIEYDRPAGLRETKYLEVWTHGRTGSKLFDTLILFLKENFEKKYFETLFLKEYYEKSNVENFCTRQNIEKNCPACKEIRHCAIPMTVVLLP